MRNQDGKQGKWAGDETRQNRKSSAVTWRGSSIPKSSSLNPDPFKTFQSELSSAGSKNRVWQEAAATLWSSVSFFSFLNLFFIFCDPFISSSFGLFPQLIGTWWETRATRTTYRRKVKQLEQPAAALGGNATANARIPNYNPLLSQNLTSAARTPE